MLCFNHNTKHAAFGGGGQRRMFTINCHRRYPKERLDELREHVSSFARFWNERVYGPAMLRTAGPERMVHLEQILANDGHLAELSRAKARADERAVARLTDCQKRRRGTIMKASGRDRVPLEDVHQ